jgi:hypothetical protein
VANVPVTVTSASGSKLVTVGVCVGKSGPYSFVVDTGSPTSAIDSSLAAKLHLKSAPTIPLGGLGCATSGNQVQVPPLRVGDIGLTAQDMVSTSLSNWSGQSVEGVLGSDVFGRFPAIKIDLPHRKLTVLGFEGPAPVANTLLEGKPDTQPPAELLTGTLIVTAPMTVVHGPGNIRVYTNVTVAGQGPKGFVVDTGSPVTTLSSDLASALHIEPNGSGTPPGGIGCTSDVSTLPTTEVGLGTLSVKLSTLRSMPITGTQRTGIDGGLGLDFMGKHGTVIVDYAAAALALASG